MSNTDAIVNTPLTTKQPFLTFLANDNNNSKRQTTMEQITKGFTHFSLSPRNGYKSNKDQAIVLDNENDIHRPSSVASSDSDSENIYNIPSRMPLRVVNPDPEDSEEEENQQQQKPHQESKENGSIKPLNNNTNFIPSDNNVTVPETMAKQNNDKHVTQFISPLSNPIEQQNKSSNSSNDDNENNNPTTTTTTKPSIFRRQSKTLDETSHSNLLPPVDRTPFNSHFTGTTPYTSQYDLNTTTTDTHRDPTITDTTTTTSNIKKRSSSLPKYNNEPSPLSPPSISNTPFNQQQQQNILSPIAESTITQPELLLQSIDSNQVNLTFNQPLFSSSVNNDNDSTNRSSIDYLNSPHPSHVGSTNYAKYTTQSSSKYTKASYSLTNNPGSLRLYRDMAKKTRDKSVQFTYACYLLEIADLYDQGRELKHNKLTSIKHSLSEASQRLRQELGQTTTRYSIDSLSSSSLRYQQQPLGFRKDSLPSSPRPSISNSIVGRSSFQSTGVYQIPSIPLSPTATTVDSYIANSTFPIASPSPSSLSSTFHHHQQQQPQTYQTFNFENNSNDDKNNNSNSHRRKKRVLEEEGIHWMKKLAKENVPEATFMLASWMDQSLYGFSPNPSKSFALYDVAAKAGNQEAVYRIGLYYESINDYKNAYQCIRQASDMGITQATLKLFKIHLHGELKQRQNMTLAISILYKATLDTDESNPEPFYLFGLILSNTYPHADIPSEVVEQYGGELNCLPYFEKAVQQGYPPAHSALGYILEHGLYGVRVNYAKSYIHYAESSKKGDPRGMVGLSRLNNKGSNGPDDDMDYQLRMNEDESGWLAQREPNEENAFYWCEKAAVQHELDEAEFLLGWYYEIGLGVPRDYAKAQWYYKKAASKGNDHALKRLLLQDNSVSKQQHDFIGSGKKNIVTTTTTTMDGLTPIKTKGKDSQQCYIM